MSTPDGPGSHYRCSRVRCSPGCMHVTSRSFLLAAHLVHHVAAFQDTRPDDLLLLNARARRLARSGCR